MRIVGLTDGIVSGKSIVSNLFKSHGVPMPTLSVVCRDIENLNITANCRLIQCNCAMRFAELKNLDIAHNYSMTGEEDARNMVNAQVALDVKRSKVDIVINDTGSLTNLNQQFQKVWVEVSGPLTWVEFGAMVILAFVASDVIVLCLKHLAITL
ncbi:hypothetical protein RJT34_14755 [Clitoria ternatea]|uniref:Uncharacterized protein n=1 Tax=Clitoria ternatea TaxID=43366 RepID=A0AAN9JTF2_CLITE